jgi:hypothetical protein
VGTKRKHSGQLGQGNCDTTAPSTSTSVEIDLESGESDIEIHPTLHSHPDDEESSILDPAKVAHDNAAVISVKGQAIAYMAQCCVRMSETEQSMALGLFPKVFNHSLLDTLPFHPSFRLLG